MIEDACAIILVQAVACVAAEILHEEESSVSSRVGRITVGRVWHSGIEALKMCMFDLIVVNECKHEPKNWLFSHPFLVE